MHKHTDKLVDFVPEVPPLNHQTIPTSGCVCRFDCWLISCLDNRICQYLITSETVLMKTVLTRFPSGKTLPRTFKASKTECWSFVTDAFSIYATCLSIMVLESQCTHSSSSLSLSAPVSFVDVSRPLFCLCSLCLSYWPNSV